MAFYQRLNPRLFVLSGLLGLLFLVLLGGLAWQQIVKKSDYESQERRQTLRRILEPGPRGLILDRNGVPLVKNQPAYSVVLYVDEMRQQFNDEFIELRNQELASTHDDTTEAHPTMNRNELYHQACIIVAQRYLDQANTLLGTDTTLDENAFIEHVVQRPLLPYTLISDLTPADFARFNEEVPVASPMQTRVEARRYYPYGALAFHTLGWVGMTDEYEDDDWQVEDLSKHSTFPYRGMTGLAGLEKVHDDTLTGKPGGEVWVVDPANARVQREEQKAPEPGQDFRCSLDVTLQQFAERRIAEYKPGTIGSVAAVDVRTGEVLVLASTPSFDLNQTVPKFSDQLVHDLNSTQGGWVNRATQGLYPPGSTFKLITSIAGLSSGIIDGNTELDCPAYITIGNRRFHDDSGEDRGKLNIVQAIALSNDVFFYQEGLKIKWQLLHKWATLLGLGQPTGIGIPESSGLVPSPEERKKKWPDDPTWRPSNDATFAIGQDDLLVTPLQMACLLASIARNETRTYPTLVHNPNLPPGAVTQHSPPLGLTPAERQLLIDGMEKVVQNGGTGAYAQIPGLRIAGKTGTAQWGSHQDTTIAWFVCFAPIDNPRIALAIAVESPNIGSDLYGGSTDGPIARDILQEYFKLYPLPTTQPATQTAANP